MKNIDWTLIRSRLKEATLVLPHFFRNPVQGMLSLPNWDWPTTLILQAAFAAACAVLTNVVARNILGVFTAVIVGPLTQLAVIGIGSGFFYYLFMFYFKREIPYRQIYLTLVFAAIPAVIVNILSPLVSPVSLVGTGAALLLLHVGFVGNFYLDRRRVRGVLGALMLAYVLVWISANIGSTHLRERMREKATPESLDILEKELNEK